MYLVQRQHEAQACIEPVLAEPGMGVPMLHRRCQCDNVQLRRLD